MAAMIAVSAAHAAPPDGASVFLPYVDGPQGDAPITAPPHLMLSFGGAAVRAVMDTGSTGIVVSEGVIPQVSRLPGEPGQLAYSSSGRIEVGRWVTVSATIAGADGASFRTTAIPVLAVDHRDCLPHARDCTPGPAEGVAMIGIGFGREADHQSRSTPDHNPFLNPDRPAWHGWIVQRTGVRIGLTDAAVRGFQTVQLARSPEWPDWAQAPGCTSLNAFPEPACGVVLMDTGVARMYLEETQARIAQLGGTPLPSGAIVDLALPDAANPVIRYSFTSGDAGNPLAPAAVVLVPSTRAFVNTSVHFLNGFDMMFDADQGHVGYRKSDAAAR